MKLAFKSDFDWPKQLLLGKCAAQIRAQASMSSQPTSLIGLQRVPATLKRDEMRLRRHHALALCLSMISTQTPSAFVARDHALGQKSGRAAVFNLVRIIVLIACAYAGSTVAGMQFDPLPDSVPAFQP
jgi:hypothetical protein